MRTLTLTLALLLTASAHAQPVWYVDADATGANSGASWADAFTDLQSALAAAEAGDEVWVAEGTYRPTSGTDRSVSFALPDGVRLFGGFDGTEDERHERHWAQHETVLSGDVGAEGQAGDNSFHVVRAEDVGDGTLLDGFVVEAGNANGTSEPLGDAGGGVFLKDASPVLQNLVVRGNGAPNGAGLIARGGSGPLVVNSLFYGNLAGGDGGAMAVVGDGSLTLTNTTVSDNVASEGGSLYVSGSTVTVSNAILWSNAGGEISTSAGGSATVRHSIVEGGFAGSVVIDADPLFIEPDQHDYQLQVGSPAIDLGNTAYLRSDVFDLDGDGNTSEPLPFDLHANVRIEGADLDLGAYEWTHPDCPSVSRLYVDLTATGSGSGTSWPDALPDLLQALTLSANCTGIEAVWVAEGTYSPSTASSAVSFDLQRRLALYGGFDGTETTLGQRDWLANPTVLSGAATPGGLTDYVVRATGVDSTSTLDGFFITHSDEAGLLVTAADPILRRLEFSGHGAPYGALWITSGSPLLDDVTFRDNDGGVLNEGGSPTLRQCRFIDNTTYPRRAFDTAGGAPILIDTEFVGSSYDGFRVQGGEPVLQNVSFVDNEQGMRIEGGTTLVLGGTLRENNYSVLCQVGIDG